MRAPLIRCIEDCDGGWKDCSGCGGLGEVSISVVYLPRALHPDDGRRDVECEGRGCDEGKVRCPCECDAGFYPDPDFLDASPHRLPEVV
jgi:hypothetical protein